MKCNCAILLSALVFAVAIITPAPSNAQTASPTLPNGAPIGAQGTPYQIIQLDGNSQVWQRTTYETGPNGTQHLHIHKYTELATGLNYQKNGQ
jgi:hypothetical protein